MAVKESLTSRTGKPALTNNMLADIVGWIKEGDSVLLHIAGKSGQIYHNCAPKTTEEKEKPSLDGMRVIWLDAANSPDLLLEGEWPYYIKGAGCTECTCSLKERVTVAKDIPHLYNFSCP